MYHALIAQLAQTLDQLLVCLDKAEIHAARHRKDAEAVIHARLAPDMKPLVYQIQSASDYAKAGAAFLSGRTPPTYADTEQTINEVRERISKTAAFMRAIPEEDFEGAKNRLVKVTWVGGKLLNGRDYIAAVVIPNVLFHASMAYAILRNHGIEIGKADFLGPIYQTAA